jgi:hypothetical protein
MDGGTIAGIVIGVVVGIVVLIWMCRPITNPETWNGKGKGSAGGSSRRSRG